MINIITLCYKEERKWGGRGGRGEKREEEQGTGEEGKKGHQSPWRKFPSGRMLTRQPRPPVPSLSDTAHPLDLSILIHTQPCLQLGAMLCVLFSECLDIMSVLKPRYCPPRLGSSWGKPPSSLPSGSPHWLHCEPQSSPSGGQAFPLPSLGLQLPTTDIPGQP